MVTTGFEVWKVVCGLINGCRYGGGRAGGACPGSRDSGSVEQMALFCTYGCDDSGNTSGEPHPGPVQSRL